MLTSTMNKKVFVAAASMTGVMALRGLKDSTNKDVVKQVRKTVNKKTGGDLGDRCSGDVTHWNENKELLMSADWTPEMRGVMFCCEDDRGTCYYSFLKGLTMYGDDVFTDEDLHLFDQIYTSPGVDANFDEVDKLWLEHDDAQVNDRVQVNDRAEAKMTGNKKIDEEIMNDIVAYHPETCTRDEFSWDGGNKKAISCGTYYVAFTDKNGNVLTKNGGEETDSVVFVRDENGAIQGLVGVALDQARDGNFKQLENIASSGGINWNEFDEKDVQVNDRYSSRGLSVQRFYHDELERKVENKDETKDVNVNDRVALRTMKHQ